MVDSEFAKLLDGGLRARDEGLLYPGTHRIGENWARLPSTQNTVPSLGRTRSSIFQVHASVLEQPYQVNLCRRRSAGFKTGLA